MSFTVRSLHQKKKSSGQRLYTDATSVLLSDVDGDYMETYQTLKKFEVEGGDPRWPISVEVQKRTSRHNGRDKIYINLVLAVGHKRLFLPRRVGPDVAKLLLQAGEVASEEYKKLLEEGQPSSQDIPVAIKKRR